jgi:hypothetical protein
MMERITLALTGDIASIASLIITIIVFFQVRTIKASLLLNSRTPETIRDLEAASDELREALKGWPDTELQAKTAAQRIDGILLNFVPKLAGAERRKLKEVHALLRRTKSIRYKLFPQNVSERKDAMWEIYLTLVGGVEVLRQRNKDYKKRV